MTQESQEFKTQRGAETRRSPSRRQKHVAFRPRLQVVVGDLDVAHDVDPDDFGGVGQRQDLVRVGGELLGLPPDRRRKR